MRDWIKEVWTEIRVSGRSPRLVQIVAIETLLSTVRRTEFPRLLNLYGHQLLAHLPKEVGRLEVGPGIVLNREEGTEEWNLEDVKVHLAHLTS